MERFKHWDLATRRCIERHGCVFANHIQSCQFCDGFGNPVLNPVLNPGTISRQIKTDRGLELQQIENGQVVKVILMQRNASILFDRTKEK